MPIGDRLNQSIQRQVYRANGHWHSLLYFNLYRLTVAGMFLLLSSHLLLEWPVEVYSHTLFQNASQIYLGMVILSLLGMWLRRPSFNWQLGGQVVSDIIMVSLVSFASGGIQNNFGLLLLISLTAAGLISRGKITLFFAALATLGTLSAQSVAVLSEDAPGSQFLPVGLLCAAYFAVAWLAHILAKYAVDSQQLAQQRGRDLQSMSEANRLVMRDMQDGVLVIDGCGQLLQMNPCAERLLRRNSHPGQDLLQTFPLLGQQYRQWQDSSQDPREPLFLDEGLQARLRFVPFARDDANGVVIFLEDQQRARAEAQQIKLAALGRLTANIAHEIRNPLSAISHASELLQEDVADEGHKRLLQIMLANTRRINQIVQDVMQLNRRDRAQPEVFDLGMQLHAFLEEFIQSQKIPANRCRLAAPHPCLVRFDRGHFHQVLWNLCHNALRYGQGKVGSLRLSAQCSPAQVSLNIADDGPGIAPEQLARLFEPFFTTEQEGTGLGLYIAKELCEANSAHLEYVPQETTTGACFRLTFGELHE